VGVRFSSTARGRPRSASSGRYALAAEPGELLPVPEILGEVCPAATRRNVTARRFRGGRHNGRLAVPVLKARIWYHGVMKLGNLDFLPAGEAMELLAPAVAASITKKALMDVYVAGIDPDLADTAAFCEQYGIGLDVSANCVIVETKRGDTSSYVACIILATNRVDVNGVVRKYAEARKASFAPMDTAVRLTGMEYGGITPIGLPLEWLILIDSAVMKAGNVIVGSGIRGSKILVPASVLAQLPNAHIMDIKKA
jgi:prolyl-tRNA editing enzyme YbaK/EbsC (Cys-tRNA(Pro) deacylase)